MHNTKHSVVAAGHAGRLSLERVSAHGDVRGLLLQMRIEQHFLNPGIEHVEVVYSFPLPWNAVLLSVDVRIGDQVLAGTVVEKSAAESRYEDALAEGDAAIMLEKNHDHTYSLNLGNLAPGETCVVTLRYAHTLAFEQRGLRLMIPTVIAPRYGDPVASGRLLPHQSPVHDFQAEYPFDLSLHLHGDWSTGRVASPSHPISVAVEHTMLTVALARRGALDRDVVLVIDEIGRDSTALLAADRLLPGHVIALASFCPRLPASATAPLALKILVDCSGSMAGSSMDAAKRALHVIVNQMDERDRFSLSCFGDEVVHQSRGPRCATDAVTRAGHAWIDQLDAKMGGTEMEQALLSTFALAPDNASSRDLLLVTDGEISAIDATIESARTSHHRLFIVGIGSNPAESHLRRLAEATGGACDFVAAGELVESAVRRMFARLHSPRLDHVSVVWPEGAVPVWTLPVPTSIFDADTVNVFALFPTAPIGSVRLFGTLSGDTMSREIAATLFSSDIDADDTLSRVAASAVLGMQTPTELIADVNPAQWAVDYQLVTAHTNFLMLHERAEGDKAIDLPVLRKVPQMLPASTAGRGGGASSIRFRRESRSMRAGEQSPSFVFLRSSSVKQGVASGPLFSRSSRSIAKKIVLKKTPLAFHGWLNEIPRDAWPCTFLELIDAGVDTSVVDWLETTIATSSTESRHEHLVVKAFLDLMVTFFGFVSQPASLRSALRALFARSTSGPSDTAETAPDSAQTAIKAEIEAGLHAMSETTWPDRLGIVDASSDGPPCLPF